MGLSDYFPLFSIRWWMDMPVRWMKRFADSPRRAARLAVTRFRILAYGLYGSNLRRRIAPLGRVRPRETDYSIAVPFGYSYTASRTPHIAVICHIYHEELADEILGYLVNLPFAADLFLSTDTLPKKGALARTFAKWAKGRVEIRVTPNRGRDIAPKLVGYADIYPRYEYVLHLHTKKSFHSRLGDEWRKFLFEHLLGSPEIVGSIFETFAHCQTLGVILPQYWEPITRGLTWGDNFDYAHDLATRMGMKVTREHVPDFPAGSMFWARSAALRPLLDLGLGFEDFDVEAGQTDGTMAHAVERVYLLACERAGFKWIKIAIPNFFELRNTILPISTPGELDHFLSAASTGDVRPGLPA